jgi:hypothetical protein
VGAGGTIRIHAERGIGLREGSIRAESTSVEPGAGQGAQLLGGFLGETSAAAPGLAVRASRSLELREAASVVSQSGSPIPSRSMVRTDPRPPRCVRDPWGRARKQARAGTCT